jgi:hypothetical protein
MKFRVHLYALAGLVWAALPVVADAAIVPCGVSSTVGVGSGQSLSCDLCSAGELVQNLINFLLGISVPIATLLFAWAGVLYFSARGVPAQIEQAHRIFRSVVIGFVIAIAAWTIVQTVVTTLFNKSIFLGGSWNTLDCQKGREARKDTVNKSLQQVLGLLPAVRSGPTNINNITYVCEGSQGQLVGQACFGQDSIITNAIPIVTSQGGSNGAGSGAYSCAAGFTLERGGEYCDASGACEMIDEISCVKTDKDGYVTEEQAVQCTSGAEPNSRGQCSDINGNIVDLDQLKASLPVSAGDCSPANIQAAAETGEDGVILTPAAAATLSCLATPESNCNNNAYPKYATYGESNCIPGKTCSSARGVFQIVRGYSDDGHSLNFSSCTNAAINAGYSDVVSPGEYLQCSRAFKGGVHDGSRLAQACDAAASNFTCNATAAAWLAVDSQERGNTPFSDWVADANNSKQKSCIDTYFR